MSAPIEAGENYQYQFTTTDSSGAPQDAGSLPAGFVVTVTLPDLTTATPTVTRASLGTYTIDYATSSTITGRHTVVGVGTGGVYGSDIEKFEDSFTTELPGRYLVSLDSAITGLRATTTITTIADRQQLRWLILASSDAVERALGRVICTRVITDTFDGGDVEILLRQIPLRWPDGVVTPTALTENGVARTLTTDYYVARNGWRLRRGTSSSPICWLPGVENIAATYTAACPNVPPILRKICEAAIARMWQTSQQQPHPALDPDLAVTQALGSLTPVEQLAWDSFASPGFA